MTFDPVGLSWSYLFWSETRAVRCGRALSVSGGGCRSPVGRNTAVLAAAVFVLVTVAAWIYAQLFSGRAAFLHVGALIGTVMAANVFFIIIPNQKKVVADLIAGKTPEAALGRRFEIAGCHPLEGSDRRLYRLRRRPRT